MLIKKDKNKELEKILAKKEIDEQAKNLLQGILYKVEVSYKDYKMVKAKEQTEQQYIQEILTNIDKRCNKIKVVKLSEKVKNEEVERELEKNRFYIGEEIIAYPIEEKLLYAIEKKTRHQKILNNKYEEATIAISNLINTGKNMDRVEVLRDFNGWSWTTVKKEIENIEINLIYQILQILLGEKFMNDWCENKDGIIDYLEQLTEEIAQNYGESIATRQKELLIKMAIAIEARGNKDFAEDVVKKIKRIDDEIEKYQNTQEKILELSNNKKQWLKELIELEKILGQNTRLKAEYERMNEEAPIDKKIFNIRVFKNQLNTKKQELLEKVERVNFLLNPTNYLDIRKNLLEEKEKLLPVTYSQEQAEQIIIEIVENFLKCINIIIKRIKDEEEILRLIYRFRYFMLLPFNSEKCVKDIEKLNKNIIKVEQNILNKAIERKVISNVPLEIMSHVFNTRIIKLEDLYYKISKKNEKYYVQIFDENVSEEKFEIKTEEKIKINRKIKIFI